MIPNSNSIQNATGVWKRSFLKSFLRILSLFAIGACVFFGAEYLLAKGSVGVVSTIAAEATAVGAIVSPVVALISTAIRKKHYRKMTDEDLMNNFSKNVRESCETREKDFQSISIKQREKQCKEADKISFNNLKYANEISRRIQITHEKLKILEAKQLKHPNNINTKNQIRIQDTRNQRFKKCICDEMIREARSLSRTNQTTSFYKNTFVKEIEKGNMFSTNLVRVAKKIIVGAYDDAYTNLNPSTHDIAEYVYDFHVIQNSKAQSHILFEKALKFDREHPLSSSYTQENYDKDFYAEMMKGIVVGRSSEDNPYVVLSTERDYANIDADETEIEV